jgi:TPR repeat protein
LISQTREDTLKALISVLIIMLTVFSSAMAEEADSVFIMKGDSAYKAFDNEAALKWYAKAYQEDSSNYEAAWKLSRAYVDVGETLEGDEMHAHYQKAEAFARRAIELNQKGSNGHLFLSIALGRVALNVGAKERMRLAREIKIEADSAIVYDPDNDIAYHVVGRWHRRLANLSWVEKGFANIFLGGVPKEATMENAVASFKKAIELNPEKISHRLELGITYKEMGEKDLAIAEFKKCLELPETDSDDAGHKRKAQAYLEELM